MNEVGMRYEHLKRERVLHNDRTEIVPNPKFLRAVLPSMEPTNCKPAATPSVAGSVKQKPTDDADLDMQERRLHRGIVGTDKSFMDTTETIGSILGRNPISESCTHEIWKRLRPTWSILASLSGQ